MLAGRYRITRVLGAGGMGTVYAADDQMLGVVVAVKVLKPDADGTGRTSMERLKQELLAARKVTHRNVVRIHDIGDAGGGPFITMSYVEGQTLAAALAAGRLGWPATLGIATQLCAGLDAAHDAGVVHRDLKPQNVLLDGTGQAYISDFGLARSVSPVDSLTRTGALFGTPEYLAPEQVEGRPADRRSDVYALGLIFYEMACGRRPFDAATPLASMVARTRHAPAPLTAVAVSVPDFYSRVVMRCLERDPERRYQRAADVLRDLESERPAPVESMPEPAPGATPQTRLLILPFRLLREDPDTGFLAFSVPDAIVDALSGLHSLVVRSSALASRFRDTEDLARVADEANVDVVVTGTLLRSGESIRVAAQLAKVPAGTVLWSQALQVRLGEIFQLQDEIVQHIVRALSVSLTAGEQRRLAGDVPRNPTAYELFLRANEAVGPQGISSSSNLRVARELYARTVEEDPRFAPAWARLGRCVYLISKADLVGSTAEQQTQTTAHAETCFRRALELNPDLPLAHSLYALFEIDQGRAQSAMQRLIAMALAGNAQPELYGAIVQACRYCGLLEPSVAAHYRARALDPTISTGGYHSLWHLGDDDRALREGIRPGFLTAIVTGMRGDRSRAIEQIDAILSRGPTALLLRMASAVRGVFEEREDLTLENALPVFDTACPDPESLYFVGRTLAYFGHPRALVEFARALDSGFVIYRVLLKRDPWLDPLRSSPEFRELLARSREAYRACRAAYAATGAERLLGRAPAPEEIETS